MKLQLFASTAAVLFSAFSGSVSATSLRGVSTTSDAVESSDYYPEVEYYDSDSADYYPESGDYDFDYEEDDEEEDPDDVVDFVSKDGYNRARARQQARKFGIDSGRSGSNRAYNTNRNRLERHGIISSSGSRRSGSTRIWNSNGNRIRKWNSNGNRIRKWNSNGNHNRSWNSNGSSRISSSGRRICPSHCRINSRGFCRCN